MMPALQPLLCVIRRVGGLEATGVLRRKNSPVIRRVGGLEVAGLQAAHRQPVIRRVGGLEGLSASDASAIWLSAV